MYGLRLPAIVSGVGSLFPDNPDLLYRIWYSGEVSWLNSLIDKSESEPDLFSIGAARQIMIRRWQSGIIRVEMKIYIIGSHVLFLEAVLVPLPIKITIDYYLSEFRYWDNYVSVDRYNHVLFWRIK